MRWLSKLKREDKKRLDNLYKKLKNYDKKSVGFPINRLFDYSELYRFLELSINNVGDPFEESIYKVATHEIEREVIKEFEKLFNADSDKCWGYVTNGGSESNTFAMYVGREVMGKDCVLFYSKDSHYSIQKAAKIESFSKEVVDVDKYGEINYDDFKLKLTKHKDKAAVVVLNIGTTVTGASDSPEKIKKILSEVGVPKHFIHCDCAFHGMIFPFVSGAPKFDFSCGIDSLCFSGHKIIGSPIPCSVVLTYKKYKEKIESSVEYVGLIDSTIAGSRNAFTPLIIWYALKTVGLKGYKKIVTDSISLADYTIEEFKKAGINAWRNKASMIVIFDKPSKKTIEKWQLSPKGNITHLITLTHLSKKMIKEIVSDVAKDLNRS